MSRFRGYRYNTSTSILALVPALHVSVLGKVESRPSVVQPDWALRRATRNSANTLQLGTN
jgi:hypothetical protein